MKKGFNITSRLNDQSKTDRMKAQEAYAVEYLPLDRIVQAADNPYRMCDLEGLAESIETVGLLTPITVKPPDAEGLHEIISGHRRVAACRMLLEEGHQAVAIIPALVARAGSDAYSRLQLIQANSTARELTPAEKVMQVSEMKAALVQMKAEGHPSLAGKRVRERLAELLEVSPAQVGVLEQIDKHLEPGLKDAFQAGDMGLVQARDFSRMPAGEQAKVLEEYRREGKDAIRRAAGQKQVLEAQAARPADAEQPDRRRALAAARLREIAGAARYGEYVDPAEVAAGCEEAAALLEEM